MPLAHLAQQLDLSGLHYGPENPIGKQMYLVDCSLSINADKQCPGLAKLCQGHQIDIGIEWLMETIHSQSNSLNQKLSQDISVQQSKLLNEKNQLKEMIKTSSKVHPL